MTMTIVSNRSLKKIRRAALLSLFVLLAVFPTPGQRREHAVESWRPVNYDLNLTFNEQLTEITSARAEITVKVLHNVNKIDFDFGEMAVDSVLLAGAPAKFERTNERLDVILPRAANAGDQLNRSEERRVGKEGRTRVARGHYTEEER